MPFTAHVPAGAALLELPSRVSCFPARYSLHRQRREPQRHQALRMAEQGLMAPLPLILQPCSESHQSNAEASLPDLLSIQVAGSSGVEELAAAESAAAWHNKDALGSELSACRHLGSAGQTTTSIPILQALPSHFPTLALKCTTQLPQGTGGNLGVDARALTAACQEMVTACTRLREGLAGRTLSAWNLGQGRAGYGASVQLGIHAKVLYAVMSDEDSMASLATASSNQAALHIDGAKSHPSPQVGPVSIGKVAAPSWETRTALLHFHGMTKAKEDLLGLPMLPTWTILANASRVLHLGFGPPGSILAVNKHTLTHHGLPPAGAALVLTVQRQGPQQYAFSASDAGSGRVCLEGTFHADFLCSAPQAVQRACCFRAGLAHLPEAGADWGRDVVGDAFGEEAALSVHASNVVSGGSLMARLERRVGEEAAVLMPSPSVMVSS